MSLDEKIEKLDKILECALANNMPVGDQPPKESFYSNIDTIIQQMLYNWRIRKSTNKES